MPAAQVLRAGRRRRARRDRRRGRRPRRAAISREGRGRAALALLEVVARRRGPSRAPGSRRRRSPSPAPRSVSGLRHVALVQLVAGRRPGARARSLSRTRQRTSMPSVGEPLRQPSADESGGACHQCFHSAALWHPAARDLPRLAPPCSSPCPSLAACNGSDDEPRRWPSPSRRPQARRRDDAAVTGLKRRLVGTFSNPPTSRRRPAIARRLFVVEQGGTIRVVQRGRKLARPYLDIRGRVQAGGEQGLLSMAFAPELRARSGASTSTTRTDGGDIQVVEFQGRRNRARKRQRADDPDARSTAPTATTTAASSSSAPTGFLYIGHRATAAAAATRSSPGRTWARNLGKILRINPSGGRASRARTRSAAARGANPRSTPTACATRGASRSTARPATS